MGMGEPPLAGPLPIVEPYNDLVVNVRHEPKAIMQTPSSRK